jgi:hypothetical protein
MDPVLRARADFCRRCSGSGWQELTIVVVASDVDGLEAQSSFVVRLQQS